MDPCFARRWLACVSPWLLVCAGLWSPLSGFAQEYYQRGSLELQLVRSPGEYAFLTVVQREAALPALTLAESVLLGVQGPTAQSEATAVVRWKVLLDASAATVTVEGNLPRFIDPSLFKEPLPRVSPESRLVAARERAGRLDAELNRVYAARRAALPAAGNLLREAQREWLRFTYDPAAPGETAGAEAWLSRGDLAAERVRFLGSYIPAEEASENQRLQAQGSAAEEAEDWSALAEITRRRAQLTPGDSEIRATYLRALLKLEDFPRAEAALQAWKEAVSKLPSRFDDLRGDVAAGLKQTEAALQAWSLYAKAEPKQLEVRKKISQALLAKGDAAGAAGFCEQAVRLEPTAAGWAELARLRALTHDWPRMSAEVRRGNRLDESDSAVKQQLPRVERLEKALPEVKQRDAQVAAAREDLRPLLERALLFLRLEWPELALADAEAALRLQEGARSAAIVKAFALQELGRREEAESLLVDLQHPPAKTPAEFRAVVECDQQLAADRPTPALLARRAEALNGCAQHDLAQYDAGAALKQQPGFPAALRARGAALMALQREWEGLALLRQALAAEPADARAWTLVGQAEARWHRHRPALEAFERALALEPKSSPALEGRQEAARELARLTQTAATVTP